MAAAGVAGRLLGVPVGPRTLVHQAAPVTLALAALLISCLAAVANTASLVVIARRHHALTGHWVPWRP